MKKRLWIIVTLGLTFTPAVLASEPTRRSDVVERKSGEIEKVSQYSGASLACGRKIKDLPAALQPRPATKVAAAGRADG